MTFSPLILDKVVMISSWIPWAKKAFSLSELRFSNGSTATDLVSSRGGGVTVAPAVMGEAAGFDDVRGENFQRPITKISATRSGAKINRRFRPLLSVGPVTFVADSSRPRRLSFTGTS